MDEDFVWLTHPDIPDSITGPQPAGSTIVAHLEARGWVRVVDPALAEDAATTEVVTDNADGPPPKAGAGSSREAWATYAAARGLDVADDDTRDDIITAVEALDGDTTEHEET